MALNASLPGVYSALPSGGSTPESRYKAGTTAELAVAQGDVLDLRRKAARVARQQAAAIETNPALTNAARARTTMRIKGREDYSAYLRALAAVFESLASRHAHTDVSPLPGWSAFGPGVLAEDLRRGAQQFHAEALAARSSARALMKGALREIYERSVERERAQSRRRLIESLAHGPTQRAILRAELPPAALTDKDRHDVEDWITRTVERGDGMAVIAAEEAPSHDAWSRWRHQYREGLLPSRERIASSLAGGISADPDPLPRWQLPVEEDECLERQLCAAIAHVYISVWAARLIPTYASALVYPFSEPSAWDIWGSPNAAPDCVRARERLAEVLPPERVTAHAARISAARSASDPEELDIRDDWTFAVERAVEASMSKPKRTTRRTF